MLIGRLGYLSVAQNEHYQLLSRKQPGPADHRPAAARLDRRPPRQADRHQPLATSGSTSSPSSSSDPTETLRTLAEILQLTPDDVDRIIKEMKASRGYQPVQVAENVPYEQYAAITVRLPEMPGVQPHARLFALLSRRAGGRPSGRLCRRRLGQGI